MSADLPQVVINPAMNDFTLTPAVEKETIEEALRNLTNIKAILSQNMQFVPSSHVPESLNDQIGQNTRVELLLLAAKYRDVCLKLFSEVNPVMRFLDSDSEKEKIVREIYSEIEALANSQ